MPGRSILVFGGTGPAGICLVRELLHRKLPTLVYARNPSKLPEDLASNPLLEVLFTSYLSLLRLRAVC
jgi:hypothetical protein